MAVIIGKRPWGETIDKVLDEVEKNELVGQVLRALDVELERALKRLRRQFPNVTFGSHS